MILFSVFSLYIISVSNPIRQRSNSDIQLMKRHEVLSIYITEPSEGPIVIEHASTDLLTTYVEKFTLISWYYNINHGLFDKFTAEMRLQTL